MYRLEQTQPSRVRDIAISHQQCFPSSFSSRLGLLYLVKTFEWFLVAENRFLFHIESGNEVIGYCGGFKSLYIGDGSTSGMLQYAMKEAMKGLIRRPYL
ncbi:MAG TPA: hypothetical protein VN958_17285, partial [Chitinophagaceae bacterium]|nr:hypothetical protein [Chitinophagaceae bacterium]